jgi:hypothetical protein
MAILATIGCSEDLPLFRSAKPQSLVDYPRALVVLDMICVLASFLLGVINDLIKFLLFPLELLVLFLQLPG